MAAGSECARGSVLFPSHSSDILLRKDSNKETHSGASECLLGQEPPLWRLVAWLAACPAQPSEAVALWGLRRFSAAQQVQVWGTASGSCWGVQRGLPGRLGRSPAGVCSPWIACLLQPGGCEPS